MVTSSRQRSSSSWRMFKTTTVSSKWSRWRESYLRLRVYQEDLVDHVLREDRASHEVLWSAAWPAPTSWRHRRSQRPCMWRAASRTPRPRPLHLPCHRHPPPTLSIASLAVSRGLSDVDETAVTSPVTSSTPRMRREPAEFRTLPTDADRQRKLNHTFVTVTVTWLRRRCLLVSASRWAVLHGKNSQRQIAIILSAETLVKMWRSWPQLQAESCTDLNWNVQKQTNI